MRLALVHVCLAPRPGEALRAVAGERAGSIHARAVMLARRTCNQEPGMLVSEEYENNLKPHLNIKIKGIKEKENKKKYRIKQLVK